MAIAVHLAAAMTIDLSTLGLLGRSQIIHRLIAAGLPIDVRLPSEKKTVRRSISGVDVRVALPITFTPFVSVNPCSARCRFCSETLVHRDATTLSAALRPGRHYFDDLGRALLALGDLPLGLSLSGLEATDDAPFLRRLLACFDEHVVAGGVIRERVLYSNANGLTREKDGQALIAYLARFGIDRVEISRHHPQQAAIAAIMRFFPQSPAGQQAAFEQAVRDASSQLNVRLVCVVQRGGVEDRAGVEAYLSWAEGLGISDVVFRELARLGDDYRQNEPLRYVAKHRVGIESLLGEILDDDHASGRGPGEFTSEALTAGYYYWSLRLRWRERMTVSFETSDYGEMKARHRSDCVYKLIFHANGNLCADWDPNTRVLLAGTKS